MFELIRAIGSATFQGAPTDGMRKYGVPVGGVYDRESATLANALLGNAFDAPCWEIVGSAEFHNPDRLSVAAVGATVRRSGSVLEVRAQPPAYRAYLACGPPSRRSGRLADPPQSVGTGPIRVLAGPQSDLLDLPGLCASEVSVSLQSDRVGLRLEGAAWPHRLELTSEPACFGTIQVTNSGQPIILGPDGPTIGGYPRIAVVIRADLDRLAQLAPGVTIRFEAVSFEEADSLWSAHRRSIASRVNELTLALFSRPGRALPIEDSR